MKMLLVSVVALLSLNVFAGSDSPYAYQWSNNGNCKLMYESGGYLTYSGRNVSDSWCSPVSIGSRGGDGAYVQYEWSNKHNCKIMINGRFTQTFADAYFCQVNN